MDANTIELIVKVGLGATLLGVGLFAGRIAERRHFARLAEREAALADMVVSNLRTFPSIDPNASQPPAMVLGEAVISSDYFKSFLAAIRKFIGGELRSYESLMMRARREALARMLERAKVAGYDAVCNIRCEGVDITGASKRGGGNKGVASVTVVASGTAYKLIPGAGGNYTNAAAATVRN
jgi:uncharacterized protein YbjQ (UPF0145 family)